MALNLQLHLTVTLTTGQMAAVGTPGMQVTTSTSKYSYKEHVKAAPRVLLLLISLMSFPKHTHLRLPLSRL